MEKFKGLSEIVNVNGLSHPKGWKETNLQSEIDSMMILHNLNQDYRVGLNPRQVK